jgi:hypothetical protein
LSRCIHSQDKSFPSPPKLSSVAEGLARAKGLAAVIKRAGPPADFKRPRAVGLYRAHRATEPPAKRLGVSAPGGVTIPPAPRRTECGRITTDGDGMPGGLGLVWPMRSGGRTRLARRCRAARTDPRALAALAFAGRAIPRRSSCDDASVGALAASRQKPAPPLAFRPVCAKRSGASLRLRAAELRSDGCLRRRRPLIRARRRGIGPRRSAKEICHGYHRIRHETRGRPLRGRAQGRSPCAPTSASFP